MCVWNKKILIKIWTSEELIQRRPFTIAKTRMCVWNKKIKFYFANENDLNSNKRNADNYQLLTNTHQILDELRARPAASVYYSRKSNVCQEQINQIWLDEEGWSKITEEKRKQLTALD